MITFLHVVGVEQKGEPMRLIDADAMLARLEEWNTSDSTDKALYNFTLNRILEQPTMPSAQPERLTDDDFETIRIHLSAYKEELCNQHRWKEAEEYQRIIDRFMAFAYEQPEIIMCKNCKWFYEDRWCIRYLKAFLPKDFCSYGERIGKDV